MLATILVLSGLAIPVASLAPIAIAYKLGRNAERKRLAQAWGDSPAKVVIALTAEAADQLSMEVEAEERHLREEVEKIRYLRPRIRAKAESPALPSRWQSRLLHCCE